MDTTVAVQTTTASRPNFKLDIAMPRQEFSTTQEAAEEDSNPKPLDLAVAAIEECVDRTHFLPVLLLWKLT